MRLFLGIFIFGTSLISAQNKELTLEELMSGTFYPDGMQEIRSMADGGYFTLLE